VPSRLHPGKFYALPQAPQQFKQLLMVAGFERYFQIAPCFRDEDARRDRSPGEFYQLDVELAFVDQDQLFASIEPVLFSVFSELGRFSPSAPPFPRIAYQDALLRYGSDKPDLRNPLQLCDAGGWLAQQPMAAMVGAGAPARALRAPGAGPQSRRFFEEIAAELRDGGASFVSWARLADSGGAAEPVSPLTKAGADVAGLASLVAAAPGDAIFVLAAPAAGIDALGATLRQQVASRLGLIEADSYRFVWVVDFPMYERREDGTGWEFCHNPFSMPQGGLAALGGDPGSVLAYQFDIVVNGIELSSGAIRNHRPDVMLRAFEVAGYGPEEVERRFGGLLSAFRCGAPPHGGLAPGVDRMLMLLADEPNLREIIAFPLNQAGEDLLMGAPSELDPRQLAELQIRLTGE
jgi:aspartyl-tRNA synthetase